MCNGKLLSHKPCTAAPRAAKSVEHDTPTLMAHAIIVRLLFALSARTGSEHVHIDSSAAIGVVNRRGSGKLRHIRVYQLWIQEMAEEGEVVIRKVSGDRNVADIGTKALGGEIIQQHLRRMGFFNIS